MMAVVWVGNDDCDDGVPVMLSLSDHQLQQVQQAAAMLPVGNRDAFLRSIAGRLSGIATPTDRDVAHAVSFVRGCQGVAFCHAHKENTHAPGR
jgi:hypothetical protein